MQLHIVGKKVPVLFVAGALILVVGIIFNLYFAPQKAQTHAQVDLEKQIAERIAAGSAINSKKDATKSIASISQELENARGTIGKINDGLAGKNEAVAGGTGLFALGEMLGTAIMLAGAVLILLQVVMQRAK